MVELTRQPSRVVSLQAGPGEVGAGIQFDMNRRYTIGRQLAIIGDQLDQEWASRRPNWQPAPLHILRPAQALTRMIYRYTISVKNTSLFLVYYT
uniref:Uncharacterized protein n=1 Tax=Labrus bergylta TaxID=56723 RepID=A0A3Q3GBC2_9LABR